MAARKPARLRPTDAALLRLLALAAKGVPPNRMAREVELIVAEWQRAEESTTASAGLPRRSSTSGL